MQLTQLDLEDLLSIVLYNLDLKFCIQYGSSLTKKEEANDIDLVIIEKSEDSSLQCIHLGMLDIVYMSMGSFRGFIKMLDPVYATEPIITGKLLIGNEQEFADTRKLIQSIKPDIGYFVRNSFEEHIRAYDFLQQQSFFKALRLLEFSLSYYAFAQWYSNTEKTISWLEVSEQMEQALKELYGQLHDYLSKIKKSMQEPDKPTIVKFIERWEAILLKQ